MTPRRYLLPAACAALALTGCNHTPTPATLDTIDWVELSPGLPPLPDHRLQSDSTFDVEAANARVVQAMQTQTDSTFGQVPLEQMVDYLRDVTGANIAVDWSALEFSGIDQDTPVDLEVRGITAEQLLRLTLRQVGGAVFDDEKPNYVIQGGVLMITTIQEIDSVTEVWVYDVRTLLYTQRALLQALYAENPVAQPFIDRLLSGRESLPKPERAFESDASLTDADDVGTPALSAQEQDEVVDIVCGNTTLDTLVWAVEYVLDSRVEWIDPPHKIQEVDGKLVVRTTRANHLAIRELLAQLNQAQVQHFQQQLVTIEVFVLLKRAEDHRLNQDYDAALSAIDQALRVDPQNPEATAMREIVAATLERGE